MLKSHSTKRDFRKLAPVTRTRHCCPSLSAWAARLEQALGWGGAAGAVQRVMSSEGYRARTPVRSALPRACEPANCPPLRWAPSAQSWGLIPHETKGCKDYCYLDLNSHGYTRKRELRKAFSLKHWSSEHLPTEIYWNRVNSPCK